MTTQTKTTADVQDEPRPRQLLIFQSFGPRPVNMICPFCHLQIVTR